MEYEAVIGLEVHCQLSTETKIFCACRARLEEGGSVRRSRAQLQRLPDLRRTSGHAARAQSQGRRVRGQGGARHRLSRSSGSNVFARKNYFYPDLPKGYQISQYERPICEDGWLEIETRGRAQNAVRIQRIHMEEDAGKNVHEPGYSLVNLNRAGTPLVEIVSEPDLKTRRGGRAPICARLHAIVTALGICDGNMQNGNFRCDANVSVMPQGLQDVRHARGDQERQLLPLRREGDRVRDRPPDRGRSRRAARSSRRRGFTTPTKNATFSMRSKEEAQDYRYFPDPDLVEVGLDPIWIKKIESALPELPSRKKERYQREYSLSAYDAGVLTAAPALAGFFEEALVAVGSQYSKPLSNLLGGEVSRLINEEGRELSQSRLTPLHLAEIVKSTEASDLSAPAAKRVLAEAWKTGESVSELIERLGLRQVSDNASLEPIVDQILLEFPAQAAELRSGKDKIMGFFVGQLMKRSGGKANPARLQELIRRIRTRSVLGHMRNC